MTIRDYLMIFAILVGPIIGVVIARKLEDWKQKRQQRVAVLASLLRTSQGSARLSAEHVGALNLIRLTFHGEKAVIDAYQRYMEHLNSPRPLTQNEMAASAQKGKERFLDLLAALANALGYHFDKTNLENSSYAPQGWQDDNIAQRENMGLLAKLLKGESYLWVAVVPPTSQTEDSSAEPPVRP